MNGALLGKLSTRAKIGLAAVVALMLVILAELLLVRPLQVKHRELGERAAALEQRLARNLAVLAPGARDTVLAAYEQYGDRMRKRLSTAEENAGLLAAIEGLASQDNVALTATKPREPRIEDYFEEYTVDVEVDTEPKEMMSFLYALERSGQLLRVTKLTLEAKGGAEAGRIKGGLTVTKAVTL